MTIKPRQLKRLDLDYWQKMVWDGCLGRKIALEDIAIGLKKVDVVVGKPGWYLWRGIETLSWFENGTEAYTTPRLVEAFKYEMKVVSHIPLSRQSRAAIWHLIQENLADQKLRRLYGMDSEWWKLQSISRGFELRIDRTTQEFKLIGRNSYRIKLRNHLRNHSDKGEKKNDTGDTADQ